MTDMGLPVQPKTAEALPEDSVHLYMQEIGGCPRLTPEEEKQLTLSCAAGDAEAIKRIVSSNLQLVVSVAREYGGRGVPILDLIQEGSIGLITAAKKFDPARNLRFSTYATKWIRHGVLRCVMEHNGLIRIPHYTAEKMNRVLRIRRELAQSRGEDPTVGELAAMAQMDEEKVAQLLTLCPNTYSLDNPVGEDAELQALLEDLQAPQPEEALVRRELKNTLEAALCQLSQRQQQVLRLYYGMDGNTPCSMEAIGRQLGISKERVRQIRQQAVDRMKELGTDLGLEDFLT